MSQRSSPGGPPVGGGADLQGESGFDRSREELDEFLRNKNDYEPPYPVNTKPETTTTGRVGGSAISTPPTPPHLSGHGALGAQQLSPAPAADTPSKRRTGSGSQMDLAPTPADAKHELKQLPINGGQRTTKAFYLPSRGTPAPGPGHHLADVGCVLVVQKNNESGNEVPILYTIYEPLKDWGRFRYTRRGNLYQDIIFDEESLWDFIYQHPMGQGLTLRIERHPYGFKCRYREPPYIKCRSGQCSVDKSRNFKTGDFRIAVDEVTGRLGADQFNDNDPYFSACFFHLQCFEDLIDVPGLVMHNIIVVDDRGIHNKEPEFTRINKMGVAPATVAAFNKWCQTAIEERSEDPDWQPPERGTLAAAIWLSSIRRGRRSARAPRGVTSNDIELKCTTHPGWGGKRVSGLSVAEMVEMVRQGRSGEMVASRNGKTGKIGVKEPEEVPRKRLLSERGEEGLESSCSLSGPSPEGNYSTGNAPEAENRTGGEGTGFSPAKRYRKSSETPGNTPEVTHSRVCTLPAH